MSDLRAQHGDAREGQQFQSPRCRGSMSDGRQVTGFTRAPSSFNPRDAGAACRTKMTKQELHEMVEFQSPRCRGSMSDLSEVGQSRWLLVRFQSPRCRGSMSDYCGYSIVQSFDGSFNPRDAGAACRTRNDEPEDFTRLNKFQSPRCRGSMSDRRRRPGRRRRRQFQSPRCRGSMSDRGCARRRGRMTAFQSPRCRGSMSDKNAPTTGPAGKGSFNPRDAGAACRTKVGSVTLFGQRKFQSPRCRGSMSDQRAAPRQMGRRALFQSPRCRGSMSDQEKNNDRLLRIQVSIPAMPGQHVGLLGQRNDEAEDFSSFNPRDAGAACRTATSSRRRRPSRKFQSPRCRGSMSDRRRKMTTEQISAFQSPRCRGSMSDG